MESIHVVFDDKKIQGLSDEGFHDNLKFEIEGECGLYDSDDDCEDQVHNAAGNIPIDEFSTDNPTSVKNTAEASIEIPHETLVKILSQNSNHSRSNEMSNLGGAFQC